MHTIIAPYGTVEAVRDAGGENLADGLKLDGGGVVWDVPEGVPVDGLGDAGAEVHPRSNDEYLITVLDDNGYQLDPSVFE